MEKSKVKCWLQEAGMLVITVIACFVAAFLFGYDQYEITRLILLTIIASGCMIFVLEESRQQRKLLFDNEENIWRFVVLYLLGLVGSVGFPLLPAGGWPFLPIFIGLMLFSNQLVGICGGSTLLFLTVSLSKSGTLEDFVIYFISGVVGALVFSYLNESLQVWFPMLISFSVQIVCLCIREVLMANEVLTAQLLIIPVLNILVCMLLLLIILKFFSFSISKGRDVYMDINDPECPLLVKLKAFSRDEYYHAIHTAYLCDRIAKRLNLDDAVAKAGGYYHKIGSLKGNNDWENTKEILDEAHFPEEVKMILQEYLDRDAVIVSKETVILLISDTVISSISYLFSKDEKAQLDYERLILAVFKKKIESGILNHSHISIFELEEMKKILMEETLYYDFLR